MKTNRVEVIENYLEPDGLTVPETPIIDPALEVVCRYDGVMDIFKSILLKKNREEERNKMEEWGTLLLRGGDALICDKCHKTVEDKKVHMYVNVDHKIKAVLCEKCWEGDYGKNPGKEEGKIDEQKRGYVVPRYDEIYGVILEGVCDRCGFEGHVESYNDSVLCINCIEELQGETK